MGEYSEKKWSKKKAGEEKKISTFVFKPEGGVLDSFFSRAFLRFLSVLLASIRGELCECAGRRRSFLYRFSSFNL